MQNVNILTLLNICHKYIFSLYFKIPLTKQHAFLSRTCIVRLLVTLPVLYFDRTTWGKYLFTDQEIVACFMNYFLYFSKT